MKAGPGYFIVLEGIDGAGKSHSAPAILKLLAELGRDAVFTREPGGVPLAESVREILLAPADGGICPESELFLFFAARMQHVHDLILPSLQEGKVVLCDRFTPSSYAYQGGGRGVDMALIRELEKCIPAACSPDLVLWLDLPAATAMERRYSEHKDRFHEGTDEPLADRINRVYRDLAAADAGRCWERVDAGQSPEKTQAQITGIIRERLAALGDRHE